MIAPMRFSVRLVFASLLPLLALQSHASPTTARNQNSLVTFNSSSNIIISHCYTPEGRETIGIQPVNLEACKDALAVLVLTPDFTTRYRFSQNPRAIARKVPLGWQLNRDSACRIVVNCENDRDTAVFRFADVAQAARRIIDNCVDKPDPSGKYPLLKWGGIDAMEVQTFYVAIARPAGSLLEVEVVNKSVIASEIFVDGGIGSS